MNAYSLYKLSSKQEGRKEGAVLFNNALNTFYLVILCMTWQRERGNQLPPHGLLFLISSKGSFIYIYHLIDRMTHTMAFVIPVLKHWRRGETAH